jgi:hypothetical protein
MRIRYIFCVLTLIALLSACISKPYNYETAISNGDIVDLHGRVENVDRLEKFNENISRTIKDEIRITRFTIEGDPLFYDFEYNGKELQYTFDNSKDKHGKPTKRKATCESLKQTQIDLGIEYTLKGCKGKNKEFGDSFKFMITTPNQQKSQPAKEETTEKEDVSIRAIGTHSDGRVVVKPASKAIAAPLRASSCYGQENDLHWLGDYEVLWESKATGLSTKVMTFPDGFEIIQQNDKPVDMQNFTIEDTDIFVYVPRYTDCHGLETYLFGVDKGKAFPISLEMKPDLILPNISQLPHRSFQITNGELIITGGYGAGQDFIPVYHFHYAAQKKLMVLQSTDQVTPNDIVYDK